MQSVPPSSDLRYHSAADPLDLIRVLLIDDDEDFSVSVSRQLERSTKPRFEIRSATSLTDGAACAVCEALDVVLLDLNLPDSQGFSTFERAREIFRDTPIVILSSMSKVSGVVQAVQHGASDYLVKDDLPQGVIANALCQAVESKRRKKKVSKKPAPQQALTHILANLSHNIYTPLNAIIGFSDLLGQELCGPLNLKQQEYVRDILESGRDLCSLLTEIMALSKTEIGATELDLQPTMLAPLAFGVTQQVETEATRRCVRLETDIPDDLPELEIDWMLMKQVLTLLLTNAVRFTPEKSRVTMRIRAVHDQVSIEVCDGSPGIALNAVPKLFWEKRPIDQTAMAYLLSFALASRLVELHGGTVDVSRPVGERTVVAVRLPVRHGLEARLVDARR